MQILKQCWLLSLWLLLFPHLAGATFITPASGNLLDNPGFETGNFDTVSGHNQWSAVSSWWHWSNTLDGAGGRVPIRSELVTADEFYRDYGLATPDGGSVLRVSTGSWWDGLTTLPQPDTFRHDWDPYRALTFSGWIYVLEGTASLWLGSNEDGFEHADLVSADGQWHFVSVTQEAGRNNQKPLLYSYQGHAEFIVDSVSLTYADILSTPLSVSSSASFKTASVVTAPLSSSLVNQTAQVPLPATLILMLPLLWWMGPAWIPTRLARMESLHGHLS
jgi:hypothetical protein